MVQYAVMIFERVAPEDLPAEVMQGHGQLPERIAGQGGRVVAGLALDPPGTATSIRGYVVTDGPFIETKEQLGGVVMLDVADLDEAIKWSERLPWTGPVEIRPVMDYEAYARRAASAEGAAS